MRTAIIALYRNTYLHTHTYPILYRNTYSNAHCHTSCTEAHIQMPNVVWILKEHTFICTLWSLHCTETHVQITTSILNLSKQTFMCTLTSYTLQKHTFTNPLLFYTQYRNARFHGNCCPSFYRNTNSHSFCILQFIKTLTWQLPWLHTTKTHIFIPTEYCTLQKHKFTCPLYTALYTNTHSIAHNILHCTETHLHIPTSILQNRRNTHSHALCLHCTLLRHTFTGLLLYYTIQKHTFQCPLLSCILKKHTNTWTSHTALYINTHSHAHYIQHSIEIYIHMPTDILPTHVHILIIYCTLQKQALTC